MDSVGEGYLYMPLAWYPHMGTADAAVWTRYINANPNAFERVWYDVKVGSGPDFSTVVDPATGADVSALYKRKIDVIGLDAGKYTIIEVKPRADTRALGQVKGYKTLALRDLPGIGNPKMLVVCESILPDVLFIAKGEGVELAIV